MKGSARICPLLALLLLASPALASRNVILVIGDGMDDVQITIARNYLVGAEGRLMIDDLPVRSAAQVLTVDEVGQRVYVADSANTATSLATGVVTSRGRIATTAGSDEPIETILEQAQAAGLRTGLVTTASVTDATTAAFAAHINVRTCEDPESIHGVKRYGIVLPHCRQYTRASGGPGSISEQLANSGIEVILGGGSKHFDIPAEGDSRTVRELAVDEGYTVIDSAAALAAEHEGRLLGLFAPSTMPVRLRGENDRTAEAPTPSWLNHLHRFLGRVRLPEPMRCEANPAYAGMPSLAQMTRVALAKLDNERGFLLVVESASIDKQAHERRPCGSIGELAQLDEAVALALEFAEQREDTLVLVTADHGHAAQLVPETSLFASYGAPVFTPGMLARLLTDEGVIMGINYATNSFPYEEHTGGQVPLLANEVGEDRVPGFVTQPQIYEIMHDYLFGESD
jgi:alkaline phosphatase